MKRLGRTEGKKERKKVLKKRRTDVHTPIALNFVSNV